MVGGGILDHQHHPLPPPQVVLWQDHQAGVRAVTAQCRENRGTFLVRESETRAKGMSASAGN